MRLREVRLANFRAYKEELTVRIDPLTALIGRNDVGKSSVFDALGIFFGNDLCKLDLGDRCVFAPGQDIEITCVFDQLPARLVLDETAETTLEAEHLLNPAGFLEIKKVFGDTLKESVFAHAHHPTAGETGDLLQKTNADLKRIAKSLGAVVPDERSNVALRTAIRAATADLHLQPTMVPLNKNAGRDVWAQLSRHLPHFALFRSDRASTDADAEVQDPMAVAVKHALTGLQPELERLEAAVRAATEDVAKRTIERLAEIDPNLAKTLQPKFREPKWETVFKLTLTGDNEIPLNKRGSGVRRLVLLAFFRAEVERRRKEKGLSDVIYAVEEPETSQHPSNQEAVVETLKWLSETEGCQVLLTTHVPALAGRLPIDSVRYLTQDTALKRRIEAGDGVLKAIADDLGVLPDYQDNRVRVFVCLEGPTDIEFLKRISRTLHSADPSALDLTDAPAVAMIPLGGNTLRDWVTRNYLKEIGKPEIHIYDRDKPEYGEACVAVNARGDGSWAVQTLKFEMENYLHTDAIKTVLGIDVVVTDDCDVESLIKAAPPGKKRDGRSLKRWLMHDVASAMTVGMIQERGGPEIRGWLDRIAAALRVDTH